MKRLISKIWLPVKSRLEYKGELTELQKERLKICGKCPHNSDNKEAKTLLDRLKIMANQTLNILTGVSISKDSVCLQCGCELVFKSSQEDQENMCPLGKWNNIK